MKTALGMAILSTATLAFTACSSSAPQFTSADEAEVRALFDSTVKRVRAGDWTNWAGEFADSAVYHPSNAKALHGRAEILAYAKAFPPIEQFSMWNVQVRGEGNLAYATSAYGIKVKNGPADTLKELVVLRRSHAGRWEVAAVNGNSDLSRAPAPPVAAPKK